MCCIELIKTFVNADKNTVYTWIDSIVNRITYPCRHTAHVPKSPFHRIATSEFPLLSGSLGLGIKKIGLLCVNCEIPQNGFE